MERIIYDLVKDRPWLKDLLKKIYQGVFCHTGRRHEIIPSGMVIRPNCFFGFHDKDPWSADNRFLLAHRYKGIGNEPESASCALDIVVFSGEDWLEGRTVGTTRAWNWQQGAQLQWFGGNIVFNDFVDGSCRAVELDLAGNLIKVHPYGVAAVSSTDKTMATFCFKHFGEVMPGYGYDFSGAKAQSNVDRDTLFIFDDTGRVEVRLNGDGLPAIATGGQPDGVPFISHALFSPSGSKLAFMRRLAVPGRRRRSALFIYDRDSTTVTRVPFKDMVSHFCWLGDDALFAYANTEDGDGYYHYACGAESPSSYSVLLKRVDGHPHADPAGNRVVFDTYPDRSRLQRLAILDIEGETVTELAWLYSPMKFWDGKRVDLHPRMRSDGRFVCLDCSTTGVRSLATINLEYASE